MLEISGWIRDRDSNPDSLIQSQVSYHLKIPDLRKYYNWTNWLSTGYNFLIG